jgi:ApaG protein
MVQLSPLVLALVGGLAVSLQSFLTSHRELTRELLPDISSVDLQSIAESFRRWQQAQQTPTAASGGNGVEKVDVQPDEVRERGGPVSPVDPSMRCFEALPPWSHSITRGVEIYVESFFQQAYDGGYAFKYHVEFTNVGTDTVQMLSRHWVFTDAEGKVTEVKGPGAVGVTPQLEPGGKWSYDSGTSIATPTGSVAGSFQFEVLVDRSGADQNFNARVGRLALTEERKPVRVPCGVEAPPSLLPTTSVHSTLRIIVGVTSEWQGATVVGMGHVFKYDVQVNNARDHFVRIVDTYWEFTDEDGRLSFHRGPALRTGLGEGQAAAGPATLPMLQPGGAYRGPYTIGAVTLSSESGTAEGFFVVETLDGEGEPTDVIRVRIGKLALSRTGEPVMAIAANPVRTLQGASAEDVMGEPMAL